jgi:hypothetical protein
MSAETNRHEAVALAVLHFNGVSHVKGEYTAPEQVIRENNLNRSRNRRDAARDRAEKFLEARDHEQAV